MLRVAHQRDLAPDHCPNAELRVGEIWVWVLLAREFEGVLRGGELTTLGLGRYFGWAIDFLLFDAGLMSCSFVSRLSFAAIASRYSIVGLPGGP